MGRRRVTPAAFSLFNQEFIALVRAGLTIPDALKLCAVQPDQPTLAAVLQRVLDDVCSGVELSAACAVHPEIFDSLYISAVRTGEKSGNLATVLSRYQQALKQRVAFSKKVSQALAYPAFLLITMGIVLAVLFVFVMPRFVAMYTDFGAELPAATRVLVHFVEHVYLYIPLLAGIATLSWAAYRRLVATTQGRLWIDSMKGRVPIWGPVSIDVARAQLTRTVATLLTGGTPLVEALQTTAAALSNRADAQRLARATQSVIEGSNLADAIRRVDLMPVTALKMIEVGEASGNLETMLGEIAEYYEERVGGRLARMMALIEPLMMLLMGILIGGIILVMYLPIFYMVEIVKRNLRGRNIADCLISSLRIATSMRPDLVLDALEQAVAARSTKPGLIHHSDRGSYICRCVTASA